MFTKPTAPRSIGGVLDDSIRLYREGFAKSWILALGAQLLVALPMLYIRLKLVETGTANPQALLAIYQSPAFWLPYLAGAIASIGFYNAIVLQLTGVFQGEVMPTGQYVARGFRLLPCVLLLALVMVLVAAIFGMIFVLPGIYASVAVRAVLAVAAGVLGIYLFGRIYLANLALVADGSGVFDSLRISWSLTRGHWWRGATIYTVIVLIALVFYFILGFVAGLIAVALGPTGAAAAGLTQLVSVLGTSVLAPLIPAALLCIYFDFKMRNEGADLAGRVNALAPR